MKREYYEPTMGDLFRKTHIQGFNSLKCKYGADKFKKYTVMDSGPKTVDDYDGDTQMTDYGRRAISQMKRQVSFLDEQKMDDFA